VIIVISALGFARANCRVNLEYDQKHSWIPAPGFPGTSLAGMTFLPGRIFIIGGYWTDNERLLKKSLAGRKEVGIFLFWRKETWK
jgi:hypothetical protein